MTLTRIASIAVGIAWALCPANRARAWEYHRGAAGDLYQRSSANGVVVDSAGDIVAGGQQAQSVSDVDIAVVKLSGTDGTEIWSRVIDGGDDGTNQGLRDTVYDLKLDGGDDVIASGVISATETKDDVVVIKLDGATGAELWRTVIDGTLHDLDTSGRIAVAPSGDVLVPATLRNTGAGGTFTVLRLAADTGAELWRAEIVGDAQGSQGRQVAVDAGGNVIAAGETNIGDTFVKLDGATGAELWRARGGGSGVYGIKIDAAGDIVAASSMDGYDDEFRVYKLAGSNGEGLWGQVPIGRRPSSSGAGLDVDVDSKGDVVAAGYLDDKRYALTKLDGSTGEIVWTSLRSGPGMARRVAMDGNDDVLSVGFARGQFVLQKNSGVNGRKLWRRRLPSARNNDAQASGLAFNPAGDLLGVGVWRSTFTVVKACGHNGRIRTGGQPCTP